MKNFQNYIADKYSSVGFENIEDGIYRTKCPRNTGEYVWKLS